MISTDRHHTMDALDAALVDVRRVLQRPAHRRRLMEGVGAEMPVGTLRVVRAVQRTGAEEDPTIGDVAELLAIDPSTASRSVDDGVARGLLARRACERDRRRQRLSLTEEGRALLARAAQVRRDILGEVAHDWDAGDLAALTEHLERLLADFDRWQGSA